MKHFYKLFFLFLISSFSAKTQVVINEIYGGGGNSGAIYTNDFVELYNNGTTAVTMSNWSIQYTSAAGTSWSGQKVTFSGTIPAKGYYLIQLAAGTGTVAALPTPDATGTVNMSATAGKIVLCNSATNVSAVVNPTDANIIDKVGFGTTANGFETAPTPAPSNSTSVQRTPVGTDTDNNSTDFTSGAPTPMNSGGGAADNTPPAISSLLPANNATGTGSSIMASVTFNEPVVKGTGNIIVKKQSDNSVLQTLAISSEGVTVTSSTVSFYVQDFALNTAYYVEMSSGGFKDAAGNNFAGISGSTTWKFTTATGPATGKLDSVYSFNTCNGLPGNDFSIYNVKGLQLWGCTTFGRNSVNNSPTESVANGVQINGFNVTNIPNEDWLISPAYNLTGTQYPLLSFYSRTRFNGDPLKLKVSTNYTGTGDPNNATWVDLNGKFPNQTSDVWTLSNNINLADYKQNKVFIAFVYYSSDEDGARWTLDDVSITNSLTPPPPTITTSVDNLNFGYVKVGDSLIKKITVIGNNMNDTTHFFVANSALTDFRISLDGINYSAFLALPTNIPVEIFIKLQPFHDRYFSNKLTFEYISKSNYINEIEKEIYLYASNIDPATTLQVVNWNIEWFGHNGNGPTNDSLQEENVLKILKQLDADVYGLTEIVSEQRLQSVVNKMPGYAYTISNFGSYTNPNATGAGPLADAQKLAFVYKTNVIKNISTKALVSAGINTPQDITNPAYNYFSSGRFPFMMEADVHMNNRVKKTKFVLVHAKANTSPTATSYARRKSSADTLSFTLNNLYPDDDIIVLGDLNDDLDSTITDGISPRITSYSSFMNDAARFSSPTLALSLGGQKSTVSYNDIIDHVILSNEMAQRYLPASAVILTEVAGWVSNYGNTTSDHYPVLTRYTYNEAIAIPVTLLSFTATKQGTTSLLEWVTSSEINNKEFIVERSTDGQNFTAIGKVAGAGNSSVKLNYNFTDAQPVIGKNYYRLKQVDFDGKFEYSKILWLDFSTPFIITAAPNPAKNYVQLSFNGLTGRAKNAHISLLGTNGQIARQLQQQVANQALVTLPLQGVSKGMYFVKVVIDDQIFVTKLMVE